MMTYNVISRFRSTKNSDFCLYIEQSCDGIAFRVRKGCTPFMWFATYDKALEFIKTLRVYPILKEV